MQRRTIWIMLLVLLVAGGGYGYYTYTQQQEAAAEVEEDAPLQTATVRRGSLIVSAAGAGTVIPASEVGLAFQTNGTLSQLNVVVGQLVKAGDVVAVLNDFDAQQAIANAELAVAQAQLALDENVIARNVGLAQIQVDQAQLNVTIAENNLADAIAWAPDDNQVALAEVSRQLAANNLNNASAGGSTADIASAQLNVTTRQRELNELVNWTPDWTNVQALQASYDVAQANLDAAVAGTQSADAGLVQARVNLENAQSLLATRQEEYDSAFDEARDWERNIDDTRERAENNLASAKNQLEIAQANYDETLAQSNNSTQVASAEAALKSAELALKNAQTPPTEDDIADAQANLRQAQLTLQSVQSNQSNSVTTAQLQLQQANLSLAQAESALTNSAESNEGAVRSAEIQVEQAKLSLRQAEINLLATQDTAQAAINLQQAELNLAAARNAAAETTLLAPIDGTVLAIDAQIGESVGTTSIVTLANLDQPIVEVFLDETDIAQVSLGNPVEVIFDAMPEQTFEGEIILVDPQLSVSANVTTIRALASVNTGAFLDTSEIVVGMNGSVEVIGGQANNAVLVPVESLRELSAGSFAVFVVENDEPLLRMVEVGIQDFTFAEIQSGLEPGEIVSTGIIATE